MLFVLGLHTCILCSGFKHLYCLLGLCTCFFLLGLCTCIFHLGLCTHFYLDLRLFLFCLGLHPYIFVGLCTPNFFLRTIHHHHTPCTTCIWVLHTCNPFDWECSSYNTPCGYTSSLHLVDAPISFILHQEKKFLAIDHRLGTYVVVHGGPVSIDSHWSVVIWFSQESPHCYKVIASLSGLYIL